MKSWTLPAGATTVEELAVGHADVPEPGPGQVRLRVNALSINARDRMVLAGPFGRTPGRDLVPLSDVAGTVDALGADTAGWTVGDRVMTAHVPSWQDGPAPSFGPGAGSFDDDGVASEFVVADVLGLVRTPAHLTDVEASTLQVAGVTAWNSVFGAHPAGKGDVVVVLGSGGVATFAAQLAVAVGARVVAAVKGGTDMERWAGLGVTDVVVTEPGWGARLAGRTGGAAKVVESVGPGMTPESLAALRGSGEVAMPGLIDLSAPPVDFMAMIGKQASLRGVAVGSVAMHRDLASFTAEHHLRPVVSTAVPFDDLPAAYHAIAVHVFGKVVIEVDVDA